MNQKGKIEITTHEDTQTADFLSGDKVICVDANWRNGGRTPIRGRKPRVGEICCVRAITWTGGVVLVGIYLPMHPKGVECGFYPYHFKRLHR